MQLLLVLTAPTHRGMVRLSRSGWLVLHRDGLLALTVIRPGTNRARRSATLLIKTSELPLSQAAGWLIHHADVL